MNSPQNSCFYEFEGFALDPLQRVVRTLADDQTLRLSTRAFDALHLLVSHHGQLADKDILIKALWPKVVVEDNNLTRIIYALRQALGEKPGEHRFVTTGIGRFGRACRQGIGAPDRCRYGRSITTINILTWR